MSYKDILVHIDASQACAARLATALALARRFSAQLTGCYVARPSLFSPFLADQFPKAVQDEAGARWAERRERAQALFAGASRGVEPAPLWREAEGEDAAALLTAAARLADVTILSQVDPEARGSRDDAALPELVALGAGRPVLVLPYTAPAERALPLGERVMVAWNASAQATRAVNDAMPLLAGAKRVVVLAVNPEQGPRGHGAVPGADLALHLARHGVKAEAGAIQAEDVEVGSMLLSRAADEGVDLIVMGVYGHSRLRELTLGGVSRHLFEHMTVPVFMSH
jgi:nucleotide-binding universal stress UspA family protein